MLAFVLFDFLMRSLSFRTHFGGAFFLGGCYRRIFLLRSGVVLKDVAVANYKTSRQINFPFLRREGTEGVHFALATLATAQSWTLCA